MLAEQNCRNAIDGIYAAFVAQLPAELRTTARALPQRLGISEGPKRVWSAAFEDVAVLAMPMLLLSEEVEAVSSDLRIAALRAHLLTMVAAQIHDRVARGELTTDAKLERVLAALERQRDQLLVQLSSRGTWISAVDPYASTREARAAILREQAVFEGRSRAQLEDYVAITAGKQSPAFAATMAAAAAAGFDVDALGHVHELVLGVMFGIAARDDICNWMQCAHLGRSWTVSLIQARRDRSDVVLDLLELAAASFARATAAAEALGAHRLAHWTSGQEYRVRALANAELLAPGHALGARGRGRAPRGGAGTSTRSSRAWSPSLKP